MDATFGRAVNATQRLSCLHKISLHKVGSVDDHRGLAGLLQQYCNRVWPGGFGRELAGGTALVAIGGFWWDIKLWNNRESGCV